MAKTTYQKLERTVDMIADPFWTNPKNHPYPTLPSIENLRGEYLDQLRESALYLVDNAELNLDLIEAAVIDGYLEL